MSTRTAHSARKNPMDYRHRGEREWVRITEVAKLIRKALRHDFPGIKFSVRSSRGSGSAVNVRWTDGPTTEGVRKVAGAFEGGRFDGMIDLPYSVRHVLYEDDDGVTRAMVVADDGTEGSRGSMPSHYVHPEDLPKGARPVQLGAKYVFEHRELSPDAWRAAIAHVLAHEFDFDGETLRTLVDGREQRVPFEPEWTRWGHLDNAPRSPWSHRGDDANQLARELLEDLDLTGAENPEDYEAAIARHTGKQPRRAAATPSTSAEKAPEAAVSPATRTAVAEALPQLARALGRKSARGANSEKVTAILIALKQLAPTVGLHAADVLDAFDHAASHEETAVKQERTSAEKAPAPPASESLLGAETRIVFVPGQIDERGRYAVLELSGVQASHNPDCSPNSGHTIAAAQPRDRSSAELCRQADKIAAALDPAVIASTTPAAFDGPPVVNRRGEVIQGNGRAIALRVAYERYPTQARAYREFLAGHGETFGLKALQSPAIRKMERPVLVRLVDVTDERAVELGNVLNTAEAEQAPLDRAKALVRRLSPARRTALGRELAELMRSAGDDATLRAALDQPAAAQLLDYLEGLDRSGLLDGGQLTPKGKDLLRDVLIGLLFDDGTPGAMARYEALSHTARMGIERAIGSLVALVGTIHDLAPRLQSAAEIVRQGGVMGAPRARDVITQADAFSRDTFSADDEALADLLLQAKTQKEVAERLRTYAALAEGYTNLFETVPPQPPAVAYRRAFVDKERLNPDRGRSTSSSAAELAFLGYLDSLTVDGGSETIQFSAEDEPVYLFASPTGRLLAVPERRVRPVRGPVGGSGSELYETWAGRPEDADAYAVDLSGTEAHFKRLPKNGQTTQRLGTGAEILYRSDKLIEPGDRKNKLHTYRHPFDAGKRPVYESGDVLVITDLAIDRRGILN